MSKTCFECKHCIQRRDPYYISYRCMGKSKNGHELFKIAAHYSNPYREKAMEYIDHMIKTRSRPKWCPKNKEDKK